MNSELPSNQSKKRHLDYFPLVLKKKKREGILTYQRKSFSLQRAPDFSVGGALLLPALNVEYLQFIRRKCSGAFGKKKRRRKETNKLTNSLLKMKTGLVQLFHIKMQDKRPPNYQLPTSYITIKQLHDLT